MDGVVASAGDLTDPIAGLRAVRTLRILSERLELHQVESALRAGYSWQSIADCLGVTRQAVHKRYGGRVDPSIQLRRRLPQ